MEIERKHHARVPVHLNAVLIGKRTVPKGCKVRNISLQGMMLSCEADGRILTFRQGENVDIHLLFQDDNGYRYLTKSADVRHVHENSIGVEFQHPDPGLVDLLKECRVVEEHTGDNVLKLPSASNTLSAGSGNHTADDSTNEPETDDSTNEPETDNVNDRNLFYIGLFSILAAIGISIGAFYTMSGIEGRLGRLETLAGNQDARISEANTGAVTAAALHESIASLNDRMIALTDSVKVIEDKLASPPDRPAPAKVPTVPAPAVTGPSRKEVIATTDPASSIARASAPTPVKAPEKQATEPAAGSVGSWVINLLSSQDLAATKHFLEKAHALDIPVEQNRAEIKGKVYWRLQITGFASRDAAIAYSDTVREKLGLRETWILERRE